MNPPKISPLAVALALLLFTMLTTTSIAAEPAPGSGAQNGAEQAPDSTLEFSVVQQYWSFENYSSSFKMPKAMEGHYYPDPRMVHGVVFPLGPEKKTEENRELLVWAHYENEALDAEKLRELVWNQYLEDSNGVSDRDKGQWGRHFGRIISGITFRCYTWSNGKTRYANALAFNPKNPTVVYKIALTSPNETWEQDYAVFEHALATFRPEAPEVREGRSAFTEAMLGLYNSPDVPVRVLAYANTLEIPRHAELEKELRARLAVASTVTEQYIILYVLASMTHYEPDFAALMKYVLHHRATVVTGAQAMLSLQKYMLADLYPWMVHNNVYTRDAWLCGYISLKDQLSTYSSEVDSYLDDFPAGAPYPPRPYFLEDNPQDNGFSGPEIAWLTNDGGISKEDDKKWDESFHRGNIFGAWEETFKALLPAIALGGEDAKLARQIVALAWDSDRKDFEQKYGKMLME